MPLQQLSRVFLPAIEAELERTVDLADGLGMEEFHLMQAYHLGWRGEDSGPEASGKRIRPQLVLLATGASQAVGAGNESPLSDDWRKGLPAAAAIELIHNFSLIHDDIQDNSPLRRGRPTVWKKWGIPQAINAGDTMYALAFIALHRLEETCGPSIAMEAYQLLLQAILKLTQGQYLDISYEGRQDLTLDDYWPMVSGKTAALLAACTEMGALIGGASQPDRTAYRLFGFSLGLAFQAQDDLLGIWGDEALTGKSADSDLVEGKKSLPVLFALEQGGAFARRWRHGPLMAAEVPELARQLEAEGARAYTQEKANQLTGQALDALEQAHPGGEAGSALRELALLLLKRNA